MRVGYNFGESKFYDIFFGFDPTRTPAKKI